MSDHGYGGWGEQRRLAAEKKINKKRNQLLRIWNRELANRKSRAVDKAA